MEKKKADLIVNIYNWMRVVILVLFIVLVIIGAAHSI